MAGKEHLSTIEMEEEYIQSLVTGTLHRATKQPTQWSCVCPSEIDWHSHYAFTTLNSQHIKSPRLLPACRRCWWLRQYNLVTLSLITASELKSIIFKAKTQQQALCWCTANSCLGIGVLTAAESNNLQLSPKWHKIYTSIFSGSKEWNHKY